MIVDPTGRYVLSRLDDATLWRFDRRWRRTKTYRLFDGAHFEYHEGVGAFMAVQYGEGRIEVSVRSPATPETVLASGVFAEDTWSFEGDVQAFAVVPEYLLVPRDDGPPQLLRINDVAELDPLEHLGVITRTASIPNSPLVVLAGEGAINVYDPKSRIAGMRFRLANENTDPLLKFRRGDNELWVDDSHNLLKLETRDWTVVDAAGPLQPPEEDGAPLPAIMAVAFSPDESQAVVVRRGSADIVVLDASDMSSPGSVHLPDVVTDVVYVDDFELVARTADGKALRVTTVVPVVTTSND